MRDYYTDQRQLPSVRAQLRSSAKKAYARRMTAALEDYRIYRLDAVGMIAPTELIAASNDDEAILLARRIGRNGRKCELWHGHRLVVALDLEELEDRP